MPVMNIANSLTLVAVAAWLATFVLGRTLLSGIPPQMAPGYPNMGQIDGLVFIPACAAIGLLMVALLVNWMQRGAVVLGALAVISLPIAGGVMFLWGGGV
jgi:hypothetical protein